MASCAGREGPLDVLVNNAAVLHLATIDATTAAEFERMLRVNCLGPFLGTRACLPRCASRAAARSSTSARSTRSTGTPLTAAYTSSKFALRGLTKVTALENARVRRASQHRVPGSGELEMHPPVVGAPDWPKMEFGEERGPTAVAPAVVYFASDESHLCNGTELVLDGGMSAGQVMDLPDELYQRGIE